MEEVEKTTTVPDLASASVRDAVGELSNEVRERHANTDTWSHT